MRCLAEGVETRKRLQFLESEGCVEVQGYYFSRAVPAAEIGRMLRRRARGVAAKAGDRRVALTAMARRSGGLAGRAYAAPEHQPAGSDYLSFHEIDSASSGPAMFLHAREERNQGPAHRNRIVVRSLTCNLPTGRRKSGPLRGDTSTGPKDGRRSVSAIGRHIVRAHDWLRVAAVATIAAGAAMGPTPASAATGTPMVDAAELARAVEELAEPGGALGADEAAALHGEYVRRLTAVDEAVGRCDSFLDRYGGNQAVQEILRRAQRKTPGDLLFTEPQVIADLEKAIGGAVDLDQ
jgi:hypothetical protein